MPIETPFILPTAEDLTVLVRRHQTATFETPELAARFKVHPQGQCLVVTPARSAGKPHDGQRKLEDREITKVLHAIEELQRQDPLRAGRPGEYAALTHNASYILGLVQAWQEDQEGVFSSPEDRTALDHLTQLQKDRLRDQVKTALRHRALTREYKPQRLRHGFEVDLDDPRALRRWVATVYWSDNLPTNDVEVAFKISRLAKSEDEAHSMRSWFVYTTQALDARSSRNHAASERADFRAGLSTSAAMRFFELLAQEMGPVKRNPWTVPTQDPGSAKRYWWQWALDAVTAIGKATKEDVAQWILERNPEYVASNARLDLGMLTVNYLGRSGHSNNKRARRSDQGSPYDALFFDGSHYRLYDPAAHGVWELRMLAGDDMLRPVLVQGPTDVELQHATVSAHEAGAFNPEDQTDAREKVLASLVLRRGQPQFRKALLEAYGYQCAVSGCDVHQTLEAAHITPHLGEHTDVVRNGLLLRADLHTLFDLGMLWIDPLTYKVQLHSSLASSSYTPLHGTNLRLPEDKANHPDRDALRVHVRDRVRDALSNS